MPDSFARSSRGQRDARQWGLTRRAWAKASGFDDIDLSKPLIGIAQTWSELNHCHIHFRELAAAVKRGVWQAGGWPVEFPTISLGEFHVNPTTMLYRNLLALDTEEMIRAQELDGVVLLSSCDKNIPAQLMGAASADVPAILLTGGPMLTSRWRGQTLGACTDCRRLTEEFRAGRLSAEEYAELEDALARSPGHCMVMGTASTMAALSEALGMSLPGTAAIPAPDSRRLRLAEAVGRQIVETVRQDLKPSRLLTPAAFENAIRTLMAIGGSTNAVVHLPAIAGRLGIGLPLDLFDRLSRSTPLLVNLRPSGQFHMEDLFEAGGIPAVLRELLPLLHGDCLTVTGRTLAESVRSARVERREVIRSLEAPLAAEGGIAILRGNLCPRGAVIKQSAASPHLLRHRGRAVVFCDQDDLEARIDSPELDVRPDDVLVLRNAGPVGGPGMPEWGSIAMPKKLLEAGVRDMVRLSDARMSGTAAGTVVLHICPEAAIGGPLALVRDGDLIELDVPARTLNVCLSDEELARRRAAWRPPAPKFARGYGKLYIDHVLQADEGADFDFCRALRPPAS
ncbi:MAG: dihydroxy-acid dehydratase [Gemmataceae bacterium]|nr:dihydroxy-acid dehydratase [Gemmataceae bacterium]MDW8265589.1 IlvD/Edd family dehydratase [Gemmataceae bacterium]